LDMHLPYIRPSTQHGLTTITQLKIENIDQIILNKLHEPMYYEIGVTCVYNGHVCYILLY